tara:strand:- start:219 stop:527 length:309 start_codon:yes stop_codon:yes gene_type:complete
MVTKKTTNPEKKLNQAFVKNIVELQKVSLRLVESNNELVKRIDKLVGLFEEASKHVTSSSSKEGEFKSLSLKLESLMQQNKDLAKGILLMEDYIKKKKDFSL